MRVKLGKAAQAHAGHVGGQCAVDGSGVQVEGTITARMLLLSQQK